VLAELRAQGYDVGRKRVARLMAAAGLRGRRPPALGANDDAGPHAAGDSGSGARAVHRGRA